MEFMTLFAIAAAALMPLLLLYVLWNLGQAFRTRYRAGNGLARSLHLTLRPRSHVNRL